MSRVVTGSSRRTSGTFLISHQPPPSARTAGPADHLCPAEVLVAMRQLPVMPGADDKRAGVAQRGALKILHWLLTHPGDTWQQRWLAAGADADKNWMQPIENADAADTRTPTAKRTETLLGLTCLLLCRVVLPDYDFLTRLKSARVFESTRAVFSPEVFTRIEQSDVRAHMSTRQFLAGFSAITKMVLHTGRNPEHLTVEDLFALRGWNLAHRGYAGSGTSEAWDLLRAAGVLPVEGPMHLALLHGQRGTADLVGDYGIQCTPVRDLLVRYLDERRPGVDYGTLRNMASMLAGAFWADIERHHPGIDSLHLPAGVAEAWKDRLHFVTRENWPTKVRKSRLRILIAVRSFYLDIQQWAVEDPSWAKFAVPCPVRPTDTQGGAKADKKRTAEIHQRIRDRLPHLPVLVDTAERHRADQAVLLKIAQAAQPDEKFSHGGVDYQRVHTPKHVCARNTATGELVNLTRVESDAFWAWAIIETLRHTGIRKEELLELTHLALVSYRLPDTGEVVPLLQIMPSKTDQERLLLVSPELSSVLATIITRLRHDNDGSIPLVSRRDSHEHVLGPKLPHLFQHKTGWSPTVISTATVQKSIDHILTLAGVTDHAGRPLRHTPHDFRRMFATDAVSGGLPVHIAARLLGHATVTTTEAYLAVFQDDLIRSYRTFLDRRRATRPSEEYREPTDEEWREFQQHFNLRKVALGDCGRPYASPCQHEHSCLRCPMLRMSPTQRPRLVEIIHNLGERIAEARMNGWLGEAEGLAYSLSKAKEKLVGLDRSLNRMRDNPSPTALGMPIIATLR